MPKNSFFKITSLLLCCFPFFSTSSDCRVSFDEIIQNSDLKSKLQIEGMIRHETENKLSESEMNQIQELLNSSHQKISELERLGQQGDQVAQYELGLYHFYSPILSEFLNVSIHKNENRDKGTPQILVSKVNTARYWLRRVTQAKNRDSQIEELAKNIIEIMDKIEDIKIEKKILEHEELKNHFPENQEDLYNQGYYHFYLRKHFFNLSVDKNQLVPLDEIFVAKDDTARHFLRKATQKEDGQIRRKSEEMVEKIDKMEDIIYENALIDVQSQNNENQEKEFLYEH